MDWCTNELKMCQQWIVITDKTKPVIRILEDNRMVNISPWTCKASIDLMDYFEINGGCTVPSYSLHSNAGVLEGTVLRELWLSGSPVEVYINATNACGQVAYDTITFYVKDLSAPVAIAKQK